MLYEAAIGRSSGVRLQLFAPKKWACAGHRGLRREASRGKDGRVSLGRYCYKRGEAALHLLLLLRLRLLQETAEHGA